MFLNNLCCRPHNGLIIAPVIINGLEARAVIDTGASASFVPKNGLICGQSRLSLTQIMSKTKTADNSLLDCTHSTDCEISLPIEDSPKITNRFLIINTSNDILGYDVLFGTDIIKRLKIDIKTRDNMIVAKIASHIIGREDYPDQCQPCVGLLKPEPVISEDMRLQELLISYSDVFAETAVGTILTKPMEINLSIDAMPKAKLRQHSSVDIQEIDRQVTSMLDRRIIEPSTSPYSSTCHLVPKKDGKRRLVINYIPLNRITVKDHFPLPQIPDLISQLAEAKYYSTLDCTEGFWQIPVATKDRPKTAFITPTGLYQFTRCPFGYTNSPAVYQRTMNEIFKDGLYTRCVVYIDDILVYGKTKKEATNNLEWVLKKCVEYNIKLKMSKCSFVQTKTKFLGFQIEQGRIGPLVDKISEWLDVEPQTLKEAQGFLGYINYYSRFIDEFSEKTTPIRKAITTTPFEWTHECDTRKHELLKELKSASSQIIPVADSPKIIDIRVLDNSFEAVCLTENDEIIARTGAMLSSSQKNYSHLEKELLALVRSYKKLGSILRGRVTVRTCSSMIVNVLKLKEKPDRISRLLLQLPPDANFDVKIHNEIKAVLSKLPEQPQEVFYTDGACKSLEKDKYLASWAVVAVNNPELCQTGLLDQSTNQKAEVEAVIQACNIAKTRQFSNIMIVSDSKYAVNAANKWISRWKENGWLDHKNKPVLNVECLKRLDEAIQGLDVKVMHIKGHQGDRYNELADKLAREALISKINYCNALFCPPEIDQDGDNAIRMLKDKLKSGQTVDDYSIIDGKLYMMQGDHAKLVVPVEHRPKLLNLAHNDPIYGAHYGVKKTRVKLNDYHWPGIYTDVSKFVASCDTCQKVKSQKTRRYGMLMPIKTSALFQRIHMDIIGPVTTSTRGNKYIITGIDAFSRLGFARACASATGEAIVSLLKDEIIYRHGPPSHIVTDNGTQFKSTVFQELMTKLDIQHSTTCEYNPQANGMDEKFNGTIVKILKSCLGDDKKQWDELLPASILAYNISHNESTGLSPYTITYGRIPRSPLNLAPVEEEPEDNDHDIIRDRASDNMEAAQVEMAKQYNKNRRAHNLKPMDMVMTKMSSKGRDDSRKFTPNWSGPHYVIRLLKHDEQPKAVEILDTRDLRVRRVPFGHIKDYDQPISLPQPALPGNLIIESLRLTPITLERIPANAEEPRYGMPAITEGPERRMPAMTEGSPRMPVTTEGPLMIQFDTTPQAGPNLASNLAGSGRTEDPGGQMGAIPNLDHTPSLERGPDQPIVSPKTPTAEVSVSPSSPETPQAPTPSTISCPTPNRPQLTSPREQVPEPEEPKAQKSLYAQQQEYDAHRFNQAFAQNYKETQEQLAKEKPKK